MSHIQMNIFFLIEAVVMLATSRLQGNKPYYDLALLARTSGWLSSGGIDSLPASLFCKDIINSASALGSSHSWISSLRSAPSCTILLARVYKRASASVFSSSSKRSLRWRMISCCSLTFVRARPSPNALQAVVCWISAAHDPDCEFVGARFHFDDADHV